MLPSIYLSMLGSAVTVTALVAQNVCNPDNCLRALRAETPKTRLTQAQQDCSAWLVTTVTPADETVTAYSTISSTETVVDEITTTNTIHDTFTSTIHKTATETVYTSISTITVVPWGLQKRAASATIPAYANPCSGVTRYTSACSCIGVSTAPSTVTLPANTVTITEPTTTWATVYETSVITTSNVVIYDETVTETVTESVATVSTATTTTTTRIVGPTPTITVSLEVDGRDAGYLGKYDAGTLNYAVYTTEATAALTLTLRPDGSLWYGNKVAKGVEGAPVASFYFIDPSAMTVRKPLKCTINMNSILTCQVGSTDNSYAAILATSPVAIIYWGTSQSLPSPTYQKVVLKAALV